MSPSQQTVINAMRKWVESFIVKFNICPFAKPEVETDGIRYVVVDEHRIDPLLDNIEQECRYLDAHPEVATTLVMPMNGFSDFERYLDLIDLVQHSVIDGQYEGVYQIATFHPDYCFADSEMDDPANYTNRAPYPAIHLIREDSITAALADFESPESIPERNIAFTRRRGQETLQQILKKCHTEEK